MKIIKLFDDLYEMLVYRKNPIPFLTEKISISEKPVANVKSKSLRRPSLVITLSRDTGLGTRHFTGIYIDVENPDFGYGDIRGTNDLLLFRFFLDEVNTECVEMVYCLGKLKFTFHYLKEYIKLYCSKAA